MATASDLRQTLQPVPVRFDRPAALTALTEGYSGDLDPTWSPDGLRGPIPFRKLIDLPAGVPRGASWSRDG